MMLCLGLRYLDLKKLFEMINLIVAITALLGPW